MADHLTPAARSANMSKIRGSDTSPEKLVRSALFRQGFRFKKNDKSLPGKPDLVFPKYNIAVFVNGCFWHGHGCSRGTIPKSNSAKWEEKIQKNKQRDAKNTEELQKLGWDVETIWTCSLKKDLENLSERLCLLRQNS